MLFNLSMILRTSFESFEKASKEIKMNGNVLGILTTLILVTIMFINVLFLYRNIVL